jgi:hypothetical protein
MDFEIRKKRKQVVQLDGEVKAKERLEEREGLKGKVALVC